EGDVITPQVYWVTLTQPSAGERRSESVRRGDPRPTPNRPAPARRGDLPRPRPPRLTRPVLVRRDQRAYAEVTHVFRRSGRSLLNVAGAVDFRASPLVGGCSCPPPQRIRPRLLRRAP